jgi:hypothetical protein
VSAVLLYRLHCSLWNGMLVVNPEIVLIFNMYKVSLLYTAYTSDTNYSQFIYIYTVCCCFVFSCIITKMTIAISCKRSMESKWMNDWILDQKYGCPVKVNSVRVTERGWRRRPPSCTKIFTFLNNLLAVDMISMQKIWTVPREDKQFQFSKFIPIIGRVLLAFLWCSRPSNVRR